MRRLLLAALLTAAPLALVAGFGPCTAAAMAARPVPKDQLLKPPADAVHYVVVSEAGKHGDSGAGRCPTGRIAYRHSQSLRGWITETDQVIDAWRRRHADRRSTVRGDHAQRRCRRRLRDGGRQGEVDKHRGQAAAATAATGYYLPAGGVGLANARAGRALVAAGDTGVDLLPSGQRDADHRPDA